MRWYYLTTGAAMRTSCRESVILTTCCHNNVIIPGSSFKRGLELAMTSRLCQGFIGESVWKMHIQISLVLLTDKHGNILSFYRNIFSAPIRRFVSIIIGFFSKSTTIYNFICTGHRLRMSHFLLKWGVSRLSFVFQSSKPIDISNAVFVRLCHWNTRNRCRFPYCYLRSGLCLVSKTHTGIAYDMWEKKTYRAISSYN